jgi:hypothetical protein
MKRKSKKAGQIPELRLSVPVHSTDVLVTQKMLYEVRDELKQDMSGVKIELKRDMEILRSEVKSEIHRLALLVEEQNARNKIVMDGLTELFYRQDRVEKLVSKAL